MIVALATVVFLMATKKTAISSAMEMAAGAEALNCSQVILRRRTVTNNQYTTALSVIRQKAIWKPGMSSDRTMMLPVDHMNMAEMAARSPRVS